MSELPKLLDGSVDDVKASLAGKSQDDLKALLAGEEGGKTRKGVIDAIKALLDGGDNGSGPSAGFEASGAPAQVVADANQDHPSLDTDPRANTTAEQNRIDFNDPVRPGIEIVTEQLGMNPPAEPASE